MRRDSTRRMEDTKRSIKLGPLPLQTSDRRRMVSSSLGTAYIGHELKNAEAEGLIVLRHEDVVGERAVAEFGGGEIEDGVDQRYQE